MGVGYPVLLTHADPVNTTKTQRGTGVAVTGATFPTSLSDIRDRGTIPVHSATEPNACGLLLIGRTTGYAMAKTGELPVIRLGGSVRVPVPALLKMLGADQ